MPKTYKGKTGMDWTFREGKLVSPKGRVEYAYLDEPDSTFELQYKIDLYPDKDDPEFKAMMKDVLLFAKETKCEVTNKTTPFPFIKTNKETGDIFLRFTKRAKAGDPKPVPVVDAKTGETSTRSVWKDSIARVSFGLGYYVSAALGSGIKPFLNAVLLIEDAQGEYSAVNQFKEFIEVDSDMDTVDTEFSTDGQLDLFQNEDLLNDALEETS